MASHGNGIALAFARTDTKMFHEFVFPFASAIMLLRGRPHFHKTDGARAKGNSGGPICLIAYGERNSSRLKESGIDGAILTVSKDR